ncbi:MAG: tRNA-dihydrouridine synthase family protein [Lachnospiraceae bacterium]|nr:tRNA-dihydrouridine synthase family protein [Lachnospiraceae bacterium]
MKYYFAPLEGLTTYIYRNLHDRYYPGIDKYFTPFIVPAAKRNFRTRELDEILPEHNEGLNVVPQILTNNAEGFLKLATELKKMGYKEVNLNLGCPSGTVVSSGKGSGFLAEPGKLDEFLYEIFSKCEIDITIKTRIGKMDREEFPEILEIYNKYSMSELIIHPRVREQFYQGMPDMDSFEYAVDNSINKLCYNGDIVDKNTYNTFVKKYPDMDRIMIGRGLISNPGLVNQIKSNKDIDYEKLREFHSELLSIYKEHLFGDINVLNKLKEVWFYMIDLFPECEKQYKKIKKSKHIEEYIKVVNEIFDSE